MRELRTLIQAFAMGEHLTDAEMVALRDTYRAVRIATQPFGDRYWLVTVDAGAKEQSLDGFLRARRVEC